MIQMREERDRTANDRPPGMHGMRGFAGLSSKEAIVDFCEDA